MKATNGSNLNAEWYRNFESLPESDDICFAICNEFFDALPIHQFDFNENTRQWREVMVDSDPIEKEKLRFVTAPGDTPAAKALLPMFDNEDLEGIIDLKFRITKSGKASRIKVKPKDASFSKRGTNCMAGVLKLIKFPKPKGGGVVDVRQPLNFFSEKEKI